MGSGSWSSSSYCSYTTSTRGTTVKTTADGGIAFNDRNTHEVFKSRGLHRDMDIKDKARECCDSAEHPNTIPVILALDVTGSMGDSAIKCAEKLNPIMTELMKDITDIEFSIMAIGDTDYDNAPIQMSQFESDVRIAEHLDKVYFEGGGGGNLHESYSIAWWSGLNHANLDCWKRGKRGIIITLGDEPLNEYLPKEHLEGFLGDKNVQEKRVTSIDLYKEAVKKYDIYHISITDGTCYKHYKNLIDETWGKLLGDKATTSTVAELPQKIAAIIRGSVQDDAGVDSVATPFTANGETISWE